MRSPQHFMPARGHEERETRKGKPDMNDNDDIDLHELETIECNLSTEQPAERESSDGLASQSASGFMMASASGFMMASASGFMMA